MSWRRSFITVLAAGLMAACGTGDTLAPEAELQGDALESVLNSASVDPRGQGGTHLFDRLAAEIPGFGGLYRVERCSVVVVLTDMGQAEHAIRVVKAALEQLMGRNCPEGVRVRAEQGRFTYVELQRWLHAARELQAIRGFLGAHVDYQQNRLVLVVASREVIREVTAALPRAGIPEAAVVFQVRSGTSGGGSR